MTATLKRDPSKYHEMSGLPIRMPEWIHELNRQSKADAEARRRARIEKRMAEITASFEKHNSAYLRELADLKSQLNQPDTAGHPKPRHDV